MQFGLKLGSKNTNFTNDLLAFYKNGYFQYIELFAVPESYNDTIEYWKQLSIPIIIHAPHSYAGMNLSLLEKRETNKTMLKETFQFADDLKAEYIIFHSGINGSIEETVLQLRPFVDSRCLIENKPAKGLNGEKCLGFAPEEIKCILDELNAKFCLDFGHAICAANTLKKEPLKYIKEFQTFNPCVYHLTDGDYKNEKDTHLHYGKGSFPINEILRMLPENAKVTNEAKQDNLELFIHDYHYLMSRTNLRDANYSDLELLFEWANDPETRANAFNVDIIPFATHKKWFQDRINSNDTIIYIYCNHNENIGQIRFDKDNDIAKISYSICPSKRNQGFGFRMITLAEKRFKSEHPEIKTLIGEVKMKNIASKNIFLKLNYNICYKNDYMVFTKLINEI